MDRVAASVGNVDQAAAEASRDRVGCPWAVCGLANALEAYDLQVAVPERIFLLFEAFGNF